MLWGLIINMSEASVYCSIRQLLVNSKHFNRSKCRDEASADSVFVMLLIILDMGLDPEKALSEAGRALDRKSIKLSLSRKTSNLPYELNAVFKRRASAAACPLK